VNTAEKIKHRGSRPEIVTIVIRREDYARLKHAGGPRPDQICMALRHYLKVLGETRWRPEARTEQALSTQVTTYQCGVPKDLCDEIRRLPGRFDTHTIEAVRLFMV
jgi:hypothetical protein